MTCHCDNLIAGPPISRRSWLWLRWVIFLLACVAIGGGLLTGMAKMYD